MARRCAAGGSPPTPSPTSARQSPPPAERPRPRLWLTPVLLAIGLALAGLPFLAHQKARKRFLERQGEALAAIADLKVRQCVAWRAERLADGMSLAGNPLLLAAVSTGLPEAANGREPAGRAAAQAVVSVRSVLAVVRKAYGYERVSLVDRQGQLLLTDPAGSISALEAADLARDTRGVEEVSLVDLHAVGPATHLAVVAPLRLADRPSAPADVFVVLEIAPGLFLYPLLQSWPTPSGSAETLLVRREGNDVLFLNELRHRGATALKLRLPVADADLPAAIAMRGREEAFEGTDYREVPVLAVTRQVPGSPWFLIAKIDRDEVTAPLVRDAWLSGLLTLAIVTLAAIVAGGAWRRERRAVASAFDASEARNALLVTAITQAPVSVVITDAKGTIEYVNPEFERVTGYATQEALGQNPRILKSGRQPESLYREMWETVQRGSAWTGRFVNRRKDGTLFEEDARIAPVLDGAGRTTAYVAVKRDVTTEVALQARLLLAEKLEAIGRLAGGIAHDFNNLLGVIAGYASLAQHGLPDPHPVRARLEQILTATDRAAGLTRQLLAVSRRQVLRPRVLALNSLLSESEPVLKRLLREDVTLALKLEPRLGNVKADPAQLEQILMNLVANARDAMPSGGSLVIETANAELDAASAASRPAFPSGRQVALIVRDSSEGMDAETQAHVFEPFFSTRDLGKGAGLGLASVWGMVKQSGGQIWVDSEPGVGTAFTVYLPRVDEPLAVEPRAQTPLSPRRGTETVLLVEDEAALRAMFREALAGSGYRVLEAESGAEALRKADVHGGPIHLLVTDVVMPGLSGTQVAARVRATRPEAKVLFISGYPDTTSVEREALGVGHAFLGKPFTTDVLLETARTLLDGR